MSRGLYKMGTFSRLTGFSPVVLRAWERRHDLLDPDRPDGGGHRLYTEDDLQVIRRVRELLDEGHSIGEIAALGRQALLESPQPAEVRALRSGGRGGEVPRLQELVDSVVRAAADLDPLRLNAVLDEAFASFSAEVAIDKVIHPAAVEIGERWERGDISVAGEHMVTSTLVFRVQRLLELSGLRGMSRPPIICACVPGEQHELGLLLVALRLSSEGHRVVYLGSNQPLTDLHHAVDKTAARAICLSVSRTETFEAQRQELLKLARRLPSNVTLHLGGMGVPPHDSDLEAASVVLTRPSQGLAPLLRSLAT